MKKVGGVNADYADFDELDFDAFDALEEFGCGQITFEELKAIVGPEAALAARRRMYADDDENDFFGLFDDPEDF